MESRRGLLDSCAGRDRASGRLRQRSRVCQVRGVRRCRDRSRASSRTMVATKGRSQRYRRRPTGHVRRLIFVTNKEIYARETGGRNVSPRYISCESASESRREIHPSSNTARVLTSAGRRKEPGCVFNIAFAHHIPIPPNNPPVFAHARTGAEEARHVSKDYLLWRFKNAAPVLLLHPQPRVR